MAQKSLLQFYTGTTSKKHPVDENQDPIDLLGSEHKSTRTKRAKFDKESATKRKFKDAWLNDYEWLRHEINPDGSSIMFCELCRQAKKKNNFTTVGSTNFKKSALDRHCNTNPEHLQVVQAMHLHSQKSTVKHVIEIQEQKQSSVNQESKSAQLRTAYFAAKNNILLHLHNKLIDLQRENKCPGLQEKASIYRSSTVHDEMINAINEELLESVNQDLKESMFVGIIVDETTDISVHKKLNIYFKSFKAGTTETVIHFVDCVAIRNGKADTIISEIENVCSSIGLDMMKVISMASDGASVMMGKTGGVGAKLRTKHNPRLVQVHCVAHRLALCASQACKNIPTFSEYQQTVKNLYRFFHNSAVRYNGLREIEDILTDESKDTKNVTLKEPSSFRWLSLESAIDAIYKSYPAIMLALESEAAEGIPEAKGLLKTMKSVSFILKTAFLKDVLSVVNKLCKIFQKDELDIDVVNVMVNSTKNTLTMLKTTNGIILDTVYKELNDGKYHDIKLHDNEQSRISFQRASLNYLDALIENLDCRFEESSMDKLSIVNKILHPKFLPTTTSAIASYGLDELDKVTEWLGPVGNHEGFINPTNMKGEYLQFKMTLKNFKGLSLKQVCKHIIENLIDVFPDFSTLAKYMLTAPLTSVACERGFSTQNRLKTKSRCRMDSRKAAKLIRIMEEGPSLEEFPHEKVLSRFDSMRMRRK